MASKNRRASAAYTAIGNKMYIFGGRDGDFLLNDLWELDTGLVCGLTSFKWSAVQLKWTLLPQKGTVPPACTCPTMAAIRNKLYVYGTEPSSGY
jgi:hypothetical protein